jgi:hypothetical protein
MNEGEKEESMAAMAYWLKKSSLITPVNAGLFQMALVSATYIDTCKMNSMVKSGIGFKKSIYINYVTTKIRK